MPIARMDLYATPPPALVSAWIWSAQTGVAVLRARALTDAWAAPEGASPPTHPRDATGRSRIKRTLLLCAFTLTVAASAPVFADHSPLAIDEEIGVSNGAQYAMFVPAAWNGRLVLYAHGFVDPAAPIALPDVAPADVAPWVVQLRETLLSAGYAVAYSSYAENGWAVKDGAARTHELRELFSSRFGAPTHVYVMGRSLGGLITVFLAENFPGAYQGALALCGPLGGGRLETDYIGNVRVLFDHFFP